MTHTASFDDLLPMGNKISLGVKGDHPMKLAEYVKELFTPGGQYYSIDYFSKNNEPGAKYSYSNISFALLGYLVEVISKEDFSEYCKKNIFNPLKMKDTGWHLKDLDTNKIIYIYGMRGNDTTAAFSKINHFGVPGYPEGMLRTTLKDLSNFILLYLNKGSYNGKQILKPETINLILAPQGLENIPTRTTNKIVDIGLTWLLMEIDGNKYYTMNGFSGAIFTNAIFSREFNTAVIYFYTEISMKNMQASNEITNVLLTSINNLEVN